MWACDDVGDGCVEDCGPEEERDQVVCDEVCCYDGALRCGGWVSGISVWVLVDEPLRCRVVDCAILDVGGKRKEKGRRRSVLRFLTFGWLPERRKVGLFILSA